MPKPDRIIKEGPHRCQLPAWGDHGDLWQCGTCSRIWKFKVFGNPDYTAWYASWLDTFGLTFIRRWREKDAEF